IRRRTGGAVCVTARPDSLPGSPFVAGPGRTGDSTVFVLHGNYRPPPRCEPAETRLEDRRAGRVVAAPEQGSSDPGRAPRAGGRTITPGAARYREASAGPPRRPLRRSISRLFHAAGWLPGYAQSYQARR